MLELFLAFAHIISVFFPLLILGKKNRRRKKSRQGKQKNRPPPSLLAQGLETPLYMTRVEEISEYSFESYSGVLLT